MKRLKNGDAQIEEILALTPENLAKKQIVMLKRHFKDTLLGIIELVEKDDFKGAFSMMSEAKGDTHGEEPNQYISFYDENDAKEVIERMEYLKALVDHKIN